MKIFLMINWKKEFFERGLIIILMAIILCNGIYTETVQNSNDICLTSECNNTATRIIKSMDLSVDPCDNFYKFTCGNFINTTIPDDKSKVDIFSALADQVREQLKPIVETDMSSNMSKSFRLVKNFYNICMNKTAIEKHGLAPLLSKLKKLGGWPVLEGDNWKEDEFNWTNSIYLLKNMGYSLKYLLGVEIGSDIKNNTNTVINIKLPKFGLVPDFLLRGQEDEVIKNYKKYMIDIAVLLGAEREYADKELTESLEFEIKLVNKSAFGKKYI
ncbi:neprilysin-2-like isoform X2 [Microplitis mediator]|uniref:neprilysin-2-like isoform X2 n=1 Tax=Microplitis mediator TaxID=375433 RepID=UPI002552B49D|nr:neprilysin-2-like isoform X2 [Microplitis mediator]